VTSFVDSLLYCKLFVNQAYGTLSVPLNIFNTTLTLAVLLKLNNISMWIGLAVGITVLVCLLIFGYILVKYGIVAREQSIVNRYNPELQVLLKK
jgi:hypothetical protein